MKTSRPAVERLLDPANPSVTLSTLERGRRGSRQKAQVGRLSSGKAAQLAGMDRVAFLYELNRIGVSAINLRDEEVEAEIRAARDLAG